MKLFKSQLLLILGTALSLFFIVTTCTTCVSNPAIATIDHNPNKPVEVIKENPKCVNVDRIITRWALERGFKVKSINTMIGTLPDGSKVVHIRRVIFNDDLYIFTYFMDIKDVKKDAEYRQLFKSVGNCQFQDNNYHIYMQHKRVHSKSKSKEKPNKINI